MIPVMFDFSEALHQAKLGRSIRRLGWNGAGLLVKHYQPGIGEAMNMPFLYMEYTKDHLVYGGAKIPWLASQSDMLASDWIVIQGE